MHERRLNLLQAVSLNMSLMVGIGPFITIPTLVGTMGGPQAMIGWIVGAFLAISDGMVWSELAALFPGSGGTYLTSSTPRLEIPDPAGSSSSCLSGSSPSAHRSRSPRRRSA